MKSKIIRHFFITIEIYTIVYFVKSFLTFEFTNPFKWIIDLPTYLPEVRGTILVCIFLYNLIIIKILNNEK